LISTKNVNNPNFSMRVMQKDKTQTLNSQPFNSIQKYLVGTYDLEIFTLPRTYQRIEVTQSKTTNVDVIPSGCFSYTAPKGLVGQIFVDKGNNTFEWVCNLESGLKEGKCYLQPGNYKIVYREKDQKSTAYTKEKSFKIESNRTLNLNL
jgi:Ca-activated chloride channel family protein